MTQEEASILQQQIIEATANNIAPYGTLNMEQFKEQLTAYINDLISNNFEKLISLLYRLDVNEQKLRALLVANTTVEAGASIADVIIERQIEKIALRKANSNLRHDIPESEKW
ncbi:hypothetical protein BH11BAC6_BH11BAC6_16950 [soil metagenome]